MAQSNAPLHSPRGDVDEKKEGVDCDNITVIKNEIDDDHQHSSTNCSSLIIDGSNNIIPIQKINTTSMEKNNNSPPSLESSADDGDAVMEDVAVTAASDKPPSGGEDHVEHDTAATTSIEDSVSNSSKNEGETVQNPLAATAGPDLQTPAAAALENQPSDGDGGVGGKGTAAVTVDDRKQKILSSIQHRRQLLAWVRESRIACEQSRNNISSGTKKSFVKAILDEHAKEVSDTHHPDGAAKTTAASSSSASTTLPTTITDEIAEYKKIAKLANSAMALQRKKSTSTISENTAPRELRRGSNIGKRMSAAVSTLNNFGNVGGWASADNSISDAAAATAANNNKKNNSSSASAILPPNHVSSSSAGTAKNNTKSSLSPNKAAFPPSVGKQLESGNTAQSSLSSKTASEKLNKKARKRASNIKKTGVAIGGADGSSTNISATLPKSATASTDNSGPYLTLSSSAIRLRDRRDELAQKLSDLLQKQHAMKSVGEKRKYDEMATAEKSPFTPNKSPKVVRAKVTQSSLTKLSSLSEMGTMKEAPRLPTRRMTQWDCILEEMRWMASDFIEERKWKVACGKTLSSSVKQHVEEQKLAARAAKGKSKTTPNKTDDQSAATETPSSSNAISTKSSKSVETKTGDRRKMSISDSNPIYVESSNEDIAHSKKVSKLLSLTVSDHWDVIRNKGAFPRTRDGYVAVYERFRKVKEELLGDKSGVQVKSCDNDHDVTPSAAPPTFQELEFDDISKKLQKAVEATKSLKAKTNDALDKERALQKYRKSLICGVDLSNEQMKAVHFIESVWAAREETGVAAVLGGNGLGRGKTIAGCATLWKNRLTGPQLVLCSPASLVRIHNCFFVAHALFCWSFLLILCTFLNKQLRWKHELMKFDDMNVKVFGHGGWSIREDDIEVTPASTSDVLLCDYSSFIEMAGDNTDSSSPNFASLILDCRHPSVDSSKNSGKQHVEIESPEWWNRLVLFILRFSSMDRLVIEHPWNQLCPTDSDRVDKQGTLDCKIVAMKLAFMYNPAIFFSTHSSIGKRVISWAKRQGDFDDKSSTIPMLRSILTTSLRNIYDSSLACIGSDLQRPETIGDDESQNASKFSWEIRKCSLAPSQQFEYNQLCSNSMLFSCPDELAYPEIAKSLLLLRKICFHASIDDATRALLAPLIHANKDRIRSVDGTMIVRKSTQLSEPCLATSTQLLEKSSKMKELLDILTRECGHEVPNELTQNFVKDLDTNATRKKKKAKVIILATLTEAQLLTSHFLSAIGLHHEVLVSFQTNGSSNLPTDTSAWAWSQNVISQFNDDSIPERGQPHRFLDILVASPFTLSSHNCGIGINSADFVISIDEDWSGRGEMHVASVLSKLRSSEEGTAKPLCKFVKIVSKGTCEVTFICKGNTVKADVAMSDATAEKLKSTKKTRKRGRSNSKKNQDEIEKTVAAPKIDSVEHQVCLLPSNIYRMKNAMNDEGFLLPTATDEASSTRILGSNVLRHRNNNLSDVFGMQMGESSEVFMPEADADKLIISAPRPDRLQFSSALYQSEHNAYLFFASPKAELHSITLSNLHPAQLHIHPSDVLSNRDLSSASIRCFASSLYTSSSHQERTRQNVRLFHSDKADASSSKEETAAENAQTGENSEEREVDAENVDNFELLVYELPPDKLTEMDSTVSRKRKIGTLKEDATSNVFSSFFELSDKATGFARDGHHRVEMSVYAPSFLPPLLDVARSIGVESNPQDNGISSITTKQNADEVSSKLFTDSRRLDCSPSTVAVQVAPNATVATQSNKVSGDHYPVEMETNPYSFSAQSNDEYSDTTFCNRLLGCDAKGAISCQAWPSLNSMILLTEEKNENNTGDQEKKAKKTKNLHYPTTLAAQDALSIPYFRKEKLSRRALLATKKVKFDDTASMAGSVRLRSRLNDLVAGSATVSSSSQNSSAQHDSGKPSSGINLPIGVTKPKSSSRLSKSLKDTSEAWTEKEDKLLKVTLARYGMNWQLVSQALSAVSRSIRSPSQCRYRWESLNDSQHTSDAEETTMRYKNEPGSNESESLIYNESSSNGDSKEGSTKKTPTHWIVSSSSSLSATTTNNKTEAKKEHIASIITKLKDVAKRRRVVSISLPGAIITDDKETTVRLAAIHPSHAEAVHIARSNLSHGVAPSRQEMWPLELLDYAEKQKKAAAAEQNAHDPQRAPANHQQQPTTSQSSRQPVAFPPQQPPPPHPTQPHSAYYSAYDPYRRHQQQSKTSHDKPPPTKNNGPS